jgi:acyl dehydratase
VSIDTAAAPKEWRGRFSIRCRGVNQRREVVIEFKRMFMVYKRGAEQAAPSFPGTDVDWTV